LVYDEEQKWVLIGESKANEPALDAIEPQLVAEAITAYQRNEGPEPKETKIIYGVIM